MGWNSSLVKPKIGIVVASPLATQHLGVQDVIEKTDLGFDRVQAHVYLQTVVSVS